MQQICAVGGSSGAALMHTGTGLPVTARRSMKHTPVVQLVERHVVEDVLAQRRVDPRVRVEPAVVVQVPAHMLSLMMIYEREMVMLA